MKYRIVKFKNNKYALQVYKTGWVFKNKVKVLGYRSKYSDLIYNDISEIRRYCIFDNLTELNDNFFSIINYKVIKDVENLNT
jgi:hypothetical protein